MKPLRTPSISTDGAETKGTATTQKKTTARDEEEETKEQEQEQMKKGSELP